MTDDELLEYMRGVFRDVPGPAGIGGPSFPIPGELSDALARQAIAVGLRPVAEPTRRWVPPATEVEHYLNPGSWEEVIPSGNES